MASSYFSTCTFKSIQEGKDQESIQSSTITDPCIGTLSIGLSILYFKGSQVKISTFLYISVPEDVFILANSADPDENLRSAKLWGNYINIYSFNMEKHHVVEYGICRFVTIV